jgi:hypothetical protein
VVPKEKILKEKAPENIVVTEDGKITFKIFNTVKVPQKKVESIKKELIDAYNDVYQSIETDYLPSERINVFLKEGDEDSWGLKTELKLYSIRNNKYPLVHELTHSLRGYGVNFDTSNGYFTQEGFATYMENKYGKQVVPVHKVMKTFINSNENIPLYKLTGVETDDSLFRTSLGNQQDYALRWMSYAHAGSFITYIIETYGLEKFEQIYNTSNLDERFQGVYGKTTDELEKEWLA